MASEAALRQRTYRLRHPDRIYKTNQDRETRNQYNKQRRMHTISGWASYLCERLNRSSPWKVTINTNELINLWKEQGGMCAVTGMRLNIEAPPWHPTRPSLDRINNKRGYHLDNVRIVWMWVNVARGSWTDKQLIGMAKILAKHNYLNGRVKQCH